MGICLSSPKDITIRSKDQNQTDSAPPPNTETAPVIPPVQPYVPVPPYSNFDSDVVGISPPGHIADREDLSNMDGTLFLDFSHVAMKLMKTGRQRHSSVRLVTAATSDSPLRIKKANSCSTIYMDDNTVSLPNLKSTLKCVSLAVFYIIKGRVRTRPPKTFEIFDEKMHPLTRDRVPDHYADFTPDHKLIYKFIKTLFSAAQLTAECAIITLIYLERLLHYNEIDLHPCNWKRILLGAILLASKVWDDQAVWNVDYCQILRVITVEDMNELERVYLEHIHFYVNVPGSMYAKYFFDLRSLAEENALVFPNEYQPLTKERAMKIEAISSKSESKTQSNMRRSQSLEPLSPKNNVIIS